MTNLNEATLPAAVTENWYVQKGKLRSKYFILTYEDLDDEEGKKDEMLTRVQVKLGKTREELEKILAAL